MTIVDYFSSRTQRNTRENTFESVSDDDKERWLSCNGLHRYLVWYFQGCSRFTLQITFKNINYASYCGFIPHRYSHLFGNCLLVKFFYKKSGELIQWKLFTSIEISDASARYINISKLNIWGFFVLSWKCYGLSRVEFYLYLGISILIWIYNVVHL